MLGNACLLVNRLLSGSKMWWHILPHLPSCLEHAELYQKTTWREMALHAWYNSILKCLICQPQDSKLFQTLIGLLSSSSCCLIQSASLITLNFKVLLITQRKERKIKKRSNNELQWTYLPYHGIQNVSESSEKHFQKYDVESDIIPFFVYYILLK